MRASEALLLGSTMLKPLRGVFDDGNDSGCALGMMNRAIGGNAEKYRFETEFPWMMKTPRVHYPCGCFAHAGLRTVNVAVIHLFDFHYYCERPWLNSWTLEEIADWLGTVEPEEPNETSTRESRSECFHPVDAGNEFLLPDSVAETVSGN